MPEQSSVDAVTYAAMRRFREIVAAVISLIVVVGMVAMIIIALGYANSPELNPSEKFGQVKDLLLFMNPLLGVVIGYYFNKVTSEARAETAETSAQTAMVSAQQATEARNTAESEAKVARGEAGEAKAALKEVGQAAEKMMAGAPAGEVGTLAVDESGEPVSDPRLEFHMAWSRAKRLVE